MMNFSAATAAVSERTHNQHVTIKSLGKGCICVWKSVEIQFWPTSLSKFPLSMLVEGLGMTNPLTVIPSGARNLSCC